MTESRTYMSEGGMTANQLADELINSLTMEYDCDKYMEQAATMLRQQAQKIENLLDQYQRLNENLEMWKTGHFKQQAEIEALKKELALQRLSDIGQEIETLDTRSYLIGRYDGLRELTEDTECQYCKQGCFRCDARKSLTDEEIEEVAKPYCDLQNWVVDKHEFARAILKKASEK